MTGRRRQIAVVDWSASAVPGPVRPRADALWLGLCGPGGEAQEYHRTRAGLAARLAGLIATGDWLVGFDFPMGYPAGFASRLTGRAGAAAVWRWLAAAIRDDDRNANNRFQVAAAINRQIAGPGTGPFWGRPAGLDLPDLPARKTVDYAALGLAERRLVETRVPRAQPVWKLYTTGSVGSQALTGLPVVARLAAQQGVSVWPFDPPARVMLAEVYPSLLGARVDAAVAAGEVKDRAQVRLLARALWRLQAAGGLAPLLQDVPAAARGDEGWILGAGHAATLQAAA